VIQFSSCAGTSSVINRCSIMGKCKKSTRAPNKSEGTELFARANPGFLRPTAGGGAAARAHQGHPRGRGHRALPLGGGPRAQSYCTPLIHFIPDSLTLFGPSVYATAMRRNRRRTPRPPASASPASSPAAASAARGGDAAILAERGSNDNKIRLAYALYHRDIHLNPCAGFSTKSAFKFGLNTGCKRVWLM
jgi:hypothetical protein